MGIGDWGLGIGDWGLGPIPNPQLSKINTNLILLNLMGIGDWGLGIGGLGMGPIPQPPTPNPTPPTPLYKEKSKKNI